ncbi:MAG: Zn-ribbon domain-containing OB-fold protein, partial [Dehalococcoidia bacterium]
ARFDEPFKPYALGLVDLPEGLRVLGRISTDDLATLETGMDVELIIGRIHSDDEGNDVMSWMFRPA